MATNMKRKKKAEVMEDDGSMTLTGHLKELRNRLIICAVVFVVGVVVSLAYADRLIDDLDDVDFIERVKTQQRNWIGRSLPWAAITISSCPLHRRKS